MLFFIRNSFLTFAAFMRVLVNWKSFEIPIVYESNMEIRRRKREGKEGKSVQVSKDLFNTLSEGSILWHIKGVVRGSI